MNQDLFKAILAMDSYNRGYNAGIDFRLKDINGAFITDSDTIYADSSGTHNAEIGNVTVSATRGQSDAEAIGFFGIAYKNNTTGAITISYRGTDDPINGIWSALTSKDVWNGWTVGGGSTEAQQAEMAIQFYNAIVDEVYGVSTDPHSSSLSISLTGHSLGGGLAGLVGSIYTQNVYGYDAMPFLYALDNTVYALNNAGWFSNADLRNLIYGDSALWTIPTDHNTLSNLVSGNYLAGEALDLVRAEVSPTQPEFQTENSLYQEVFLQNYGEILGGLGAIQLHSIPSLIIRMFADTEINGVTDWKSASPYFWKVLYDGEFARDIGASGVQGHLLDQAIAGDLSKYADILRQSLAYSIIDEGTKLFGNTGIRAFYNDANDLGKALSNNDVSSNLVARASDISKAFIQYAGELALNKVVLNTGEHGNDAVLKGVLNYAGNVLTVDFSDKTWDLIGASHNITPQYCLTKGILGEVGDSYVRDAMQELWGNSSSNIFEKISFAATESGSFYLSDPASPDMYPVRGSWTNRGVLLR